MSEQNEWVNVEARLRQSDLKAAYDAGVASQQAEIERLREENRRMRTGLEQIVRVGQEFAKTARAALEAKPHERGERSK